MLKANLTHAALVSVAFALVFATSGSAFAKKKQPANPTYEQAWALCKKELDQHHISSNYSPGQRYAAGGACMHRYGYRI